MRPTGLIILIVFVLIVSIPVHPAEEAHGPVAISPDPSPDWSQYQADAAHDGYTASYGPNHGGLIWSSLIGGSLDGLTVTGGDLIVGGSGILTSLNSTDGLAGTEFSVNGGGFTTYPAYGGGLVYAENILNYYGVHNYVRADYLSDGSNVWQNVVSGTSSSGLEAGGMMAYYNGVLYYVGLGTSQLSAFLGSSGYTLWEVNTSSPISSPPTVGSGMIVVGFVNNNSVEAFNYQKGNFYWNFSTDSPVTQSVSYNNGSFYFGTTLGTLYAITAYGTQSWTRNLNSAIESTPAIANGKLYVTTAGGQLYCLNAVNGYVYWEFNDTSSLISSPAVSSNGVVYIADSSGSIYAFNTSTGSLLWSYNTGVSIISSLAVYDGYLYAVDTTGDVYAFTNTNYATFVESGLPQGTRWSVTVNGTTKTSATNSIIFAELDGSYTYTIRPIYGYTLSASGGTLILNGFDSTVKVTFTPTNYQVTFSEKGLPGGKWYVNITNPLGVTANYSSTSNKIEVSETNGTYSFLVASNNPTYIPNPSSGTFTVTGNPILESISFTMLGWNATFVESGLPKGSVWYVNLTNGQAFSSSSNSISFTEPNGTYSYAISTGDKRYEPSKTSGTFTISGMSYYFSLIFNPEYHRVTFTEFGLPNGTLWKVTLNGTSSESDNSTINFNELNGSYYYKVSSISRYAATPSSGNVQIDGSNATLSIVFTIDAFSVSFKETGLPSGERWNATLDNYTVNSTGTSIIFSDVLNGNHHFEIGRPIGYASNVTSGNISVNGQNLSVQVGFQVGWNFPSAPLDVKATGSLGQIIIKWNPPQNNGAPPGFNGSGIESYYIYRSTSSGMEQYYDKISGTQTTYVDSSVSSGNIYFYEITAVNPIGQSGFSNEVSAQPLTITIPSPPSNLTAIPEEGGIYLGFDPPASSGGSQITEYVIYRGTQPDSEVVYKTLPANTTHYLDTDIVPGQVYYYFVVAVNTGGQGNPTQPIEATAPKTVISIPPWSSESPYFWEFFVAVGTIATLIVMIVTLIFTAKRKEKPKIEKKGETIEKKIEPESKQTKSK